jgi:hypothetical protein
MKLPWLLVLLVAALAGRASAEDARPVGRYAPKGRPPEGMPAWMAAAAAAPAGPLATDTKYLYATTRTLTGAYTAGAGATILQGDPALGVGDAHSLAEIWVASEDRMQIVELGWTVDPLVNGDIQPRLFVFHWIDGNQTCYNGCGFRQVAATKRPGMRVIAGEAHRYEIKLVYFDWWVFYDGEAIGYFPHTEWGGRFLKAAQVLWYGEVAAATTTPCTQMGNGKPGGDMGAAAYTDMHVFNIDGDDAPAVSLASTVTNDALYSLETMGPSAFRFGGPGATSGCCTPSSCAQVAAECGQVGDPLCPTNTLQCGPCEGAACTPDHTCPGGVGPRDDGQAFDSPGPISAGCCGVGGAAPGPTPLVAALVVVAVRRRRAFLRLRAGAAARVE